MIFTLPEEELGCGERGARRGPGEGHHVSRDGGEELDEGTLSLIDNQIDQATGTIKLKAIFHNAHNTLGRDSIVNARVLVRTDRNALTIPSTAPCNSGPNGPFTYVVKSDSTVEVRPLHDRRESRRHDHRHRRPGGDERVVTSNQYRLQPGAHVHDAARRTGECRHAAPRGGGPRGVMSISEPFVRRPIATSLLMGGIFLVGSWSTRCCRSRRCRRWIFRLSR